MDYWVPGVTVSGVHELFANALVMRGKRSGRRTCAANRWQEREPMKLYNRGLIIAGIVVFLIAATFPFWYGRGKRCPAGSEARHARHRRLTEKLCVETAP